MLHWGLSDEPFFAWGDPRRLWRSGIRHRLRAVFGAATATRPRRCEQIALSLRDRHDGARHRRLGRRPVRARDRAIPSLEWVKGVGVIGSVERGFRSPQPLDAGAALLAFDAALACRRGGLGCPPFERRTRRAADKIQQALACILSVARLRAMPLRGN